MDMSTTMTQDEYFEKSESRTVVTPENIGGLLEYPALFHAMQDNRELRPALSEAMSTGRAMTDFLSMSPEAFLEKYVVADGPVNPKTGKPYGTDTKAFIEWKAMQPKIPVSTEQFNMFGKMAQAYNSHAFIKLLGTHERTRNAIFSADIEGVACLVKVDNLYRDNGSIVAVDVKTTSDLNSFGRSARGLYYAEQQALIYRVLAANGIQEPQIAIAALEKGPMPRCGIFSIGELMDAEAALLLTLHSYADSLKTGKFSTGFEAPIVI